MKTLSTIFLLFVGFLPVFSQTIIFNEDFDDEPNSNDINGGIITGSANGYMWVASGLSSCDATGYFGVLDGVFRVNDIEGFFCDPTCGGFDGGSADNYWEVRGIDISGFDSIAIAINISASGDFEGSGCGYDQITVAYIIDGEEEYSKTIEGNDLERPFSFDTIGLSGNELDIAIVMGNQAQSENFLFNQIVVIGQIAGADTDGDFVPDSLDICPGGNDLVDTDAGGKGMPDDCDCDPNDSSDEFIIVNNNNVTNTAIDADTTYRGSYSLTSDGIVEMDSVLTFIAGVEITLQENFHAKNGSTFAAQIIPDCNTPAASSMQNLVVQNNFIQRQKVSLDIFPNPANTNVQLQFSLPSVDWIQLRIFNTQGQMIKEIYSKTILAEGEHYKNIQVQHLPEGLYYVELWTAGERIVEKLIVTR